MNIRQISEIFDNRSWRPACFLFLILILTNNLATAQQQKGGRLYESQYDALSFVFSPDGKLLAISRGSADSQFRGGQVDVWNVETKKLIRVIRGFDGSVWSAVF